MKKTFKPTILQVIPSLSSGGVERGVIEICKILKKSEYNVIVTSSGGRLVDDLLSHGVTHISYNVSTKNPFKILYNTQFFIDLIKEKNIDIIHARSRAPAWSSYFASKVLNKSFITTFHGIYNIENKLKKFYNSIMLRGEKVIAVSNFVKQHILENYNVQADKIVVIHRGVNSNYFSPKNIDSEKMGRYKRKYNLINDVPVILIPSRMSNWKGHHIIVKALNKIKKYDFQCLMVGDILKHKNYTIKIKNLIESLGLVKKINIFPIEYDMLHLYAVSDIVVSASILPEAFGRTVIEAQAMQKIVIATNIGGASETVKDFINGFHVMPNDITDLALKLEFCIKNLSSDSIIKIQKAARNEVKEKFSIELMLDKTLKLYNSI